ncbi:MAG: UV DNA damage repair endonuclease UvsE [Candidatus Thermoplasmatota archaeon]|nr:UV DNA damage repair endonuclease UvsE [Candidatus Thermoplasmatota archaeon]
MKVGYPCINRSMECRGNKTFRLDSYSEDRLIETVQNNLNCLEEMLKFNIEHDIYFFRITSDLIPFASHEVNDHDWQSHFRNEFQKIGNFIKDNHIRISMHPDQFIVLNSKKEDVVKRSIEELRYHADVLDLFGLDSTAKIQLHVGGVYGDKDKSKRRFVKRFQRLDEKIKRRLVIENDDTSYSLKDCLDIHHHSGVPVLFDNLHHRVNSSGEGLEKALEKSNNTWSEKDGIPMVDYSSQEANKKEGKHAETIDKNDFRDFIELSRPHDFDLMLEIKDKEKSALKAVDILSKDERFH